MDESNLKNFKEQIIDRHGISDELLHQMNLELLRGHQWIAYNTVPYFLEKCDVYFFKDKDEVNDFARNNISDYDNYRVINGKELSKKVSQTLGNVMNSFTQKQIL